MIPRRAQIRYDLGCGALSVRRKFMEVINNLRPAIDPRSATGHSGGGGGGGGGGRREESESVGSVTDDEHDQEAYGGIDTRDRKSRSADGPRGGEMKEEERKMRQAEAKEAWRNEEVRLVKRSARWLAGRLELILGATLLRTHRSFLPPLAAG